VKLLRHAIPNDDMCFPNWEATFFYDFSDKPEREWLINSLVTQFNSMYYGKWGKLLRNPSHTARNSQPLTAI
jgi:hypothetical protein